MKGDRPYLEHIQENILAILDFTCNGREEFLSNKQVHYAVIRAFEIIGEATKHLSTELKNRQAHISWRRIAGLRDVLIHGYMGIDLERVWIIVENELEPLLKVVQAELKTCK